MHCDRFDLSDFADRLRSLRHAYAGAIDLPALSATEFAHMLGLVPADYDELEQGMQEPPMAVLVMLHRRTGVSLDWLIAPELPARDGDRSGIHSSTLFRAAS